MRARLFNTNALLVVLIILEHLFLYYFFDNKILTQGKNAIGLFLTSIAFGLVLIYRFYEVRNNAIVKVPFTVNKLFYFLVPLILVSFALLAMGYKDLYARYPLIVKTSDVIPGIQIVCKRLLTGRYAYDLLWDFGGPQVFPYLPMHWMPFTIAEVCHFDYRWIAFGAWCMAALWLCIKNMRQQNPFVQILIPLLVVGSNYMLFANQPVIIFASVELLITAYYILLVMGLNQQNGYVQGLFIALCLLSRYSVVLWLPLYAFVLFVSGNRKQLYQSAVTAATLVILLYVWPFLSKHWSIFYDGYKSYDNAAYYEWAKNLKDKDMPWNLFSGTGAAYLIYTRLTTWDMMARIKLLQKIHLVCSLGVTVILGAWYWFNREKINFRIFLLASFKIYLAVFLFFIQVPYIYLMCLVNFVSIAIWAEQCRYSIRPEQALSNEPQNTLAARSAA